MIQLNQALIFSCISYLMDLSQGLLKNHLEIVIYIVCSVQAIQDEYLEHFACNAEP